MSANQRVVQEEHKVYADGSEKHVVTDEVKDGRSLGQKIDDAKAAFNTTDKLQKQEHEKHEIRDGKEVHTKSTEVKDARSLGEKIGDAKDAFVGK
ncbi:uncharacterized protein LOC129582649 [Paramacrobiotus metropolitanus]|uniref:uncharacterized protein LOC129582649 n=1 Tax=Paramacrobiotus metropolitanus TaxID=2943436 RepID=UPI0024460E74|nr:uncharacterized protein LOC129582649 [Paramacrobiotus metropolitanus]